MEIGLGRNVRSEMKMRKILGAILLAVFFCILTSAINAQRKSQLGKVCGDPTAELLDEGCPVLPIAGEPERPAQRQPMLMTIELPDDFVIGPVWIEIVDVRPEA